MAVHIEDRLISKIIKEGDFRTVLKAKMKPELFSVTMARSMFVSIWKYYHSPKHPGQVPKRRWMSTRFSNFKDLKHGKETLEELCEEVRQAAVARALVDVIEDVPLEIQDDPYKALDRLRSGVLSIQGMTATSRDIYLAEYGNESMREYELRKNAEGVMGIPWPWDEFTEETQGMLPEEFIVIYGRMKSMKTFVGILIAAHAYIESNRRVMFYSAEMSPPQIMKRMIPALCYVSGQPIDYKAFKNGELGQRDEQYVRSLLLNVELEKQRERDGERSRSLLVTSDKGDDNRIGGVSHIRAKAEEFDPDIILVDSYYRLRDDRSGKNDYDWKVQAAIAQDLKHLAQQLQVPVIGLSQANRSSENKALAEGMSDASYADATGQEADLGMRIVKGAKDGYGTKLTVVIAAAREIEADGFYLKVKPYTRFKFDGWMRTTPEDETPPSPTAIKIKREAKKQQNKDEQPRTAQERRSDQSAVSKLASKRRKK